MYGHLIKILELVPKGLKKMAKDILELGFEEEPQYQGYIDMIQKQILAAAYIGSELELTFLDEKNSNGKIEE